MPQSLSLSRREHPQLCSPERISEKCWSRACSAISSLLYAAPPMYPRQGELMDPDGYRQREDPNRCPPDRSRAGSLSTRSGTYPPQHNASIPNTSLQLVWFLAPTAALAHQQHNVIWSQLPAFRPQLRLLLGADHVDLWSEQHLWDSVLLNVRIVVSTHQVCRDTSNRSNF